MKDLLLNVAEEIMRQKDYLTKLDAACGDGDFGVGMYIGFKNAKTSIKHYEEGNIGSLLEKVGYAILSSVGGASGPLFGTIFVEVGKVAKGKSEINLQHLATMFDMALQKVYQLGGTKVGDKTLVDALEPAVNVLKKASNEGLNLMEALKKATEAAEKGAEATKNLVARQGKARYLGEETLGHPDPGAVAIYLIFKAMLSAYQSCLSHKP